MNCIIIDDEKSARSLIKTFLKENFAQFDSFFEASNLEEGVALLKKEKIDIVYLDIQMPGESGLEIINYFDTEAMNFKIIFTTAYHQYAVDAFKLNALDYLLKPIDEQELIKATQKAIAEIEKNELGTKLESLKEALEQIAVTKIALDVPKGILFMNLDDIVYFEADGMYTKVHLKTDETKLVSKPLKFFSDQLENKPIFFKCHRSFLVNLMYVKELVKSDGDYLILENKKTIPIAKSKKDEFMAVIKDTFW
ncbi:LytTR family DNA-binding domain-containing protein [Flavobacterium sp. NRK F10]|uniref:LytR/AlgR family response regulator transcription factor n=1 Tax=Flavobacterium sp. NRK F10 TaxID=2954931 RepID=UPI002090C003|nr:LytTR family DNA-binding domain-containing protein [Flavobacterium sp. NRK F10]MCO6173638.1 LytTR family DNA-binding domain-containing protein [Flavobacterium sp. NRK F10]